jgi:methyltransferase (TIGR00027 family)
MNSSVESNPIRNVSDTALWVAVYRAMESERSDAHFNDPFARRLAGERGELIVKTMPSGMQMSWPMVVRTAVMDEIILRCVQQGVDTVLNLAAGLDTRAYRLDLPKTLRWYHVDFPDMVDYVQQHMKDEVPRCQLEYISADLRESSTRQKLFSEAASGRSVLVITEGLLVYLQSEQVAELAKDLHDIARARWWLTDLASPYLLKMLKKRLGNNLQKGNAPMQFAPAQGTAFFKDFGWRESEFRSTWKEGIRLKRTMAFAWLWELLMHLQSKKRKAESERMSGIVLFEAN